MKYIICLLLLFTCSFSRAQLVRGIVTSADTGDALQNVSIYNTAAKFSTVSDARGYFEINANAGDRIELRLTGYRDTFFRAGREGSFTRLSMQRMNVQLSEFTVHGLTIYQKDSIARRELYRKELDRTSSKPQFEMNGGVGASGLISSFAQKFNKNYKRNQAFKKTFAADEQQHFIDTRYTPSLTSSLTQLTGDDLATFMNTYPMDFQFARTATDLELKMWIRDNYKTYIKKEK